MVPMTIQFLEPLYYYSGICIHLTGAPHGSRMQFSKTDTAVGFAGVEGGRVGDTRPVKEESSSLGQMPVGLPLDPYWYPQW